MPNDNLAVGAVRWDLSSIYSGMDDPQIDFDIAEFAKQAELFNANYKGKLADTLGRAIADYSELEMLGERSWSIFPSCKAWT